MNTKFMEVYWTHLHVSSPRYVHDAMLLHVVRDDREYAMNALNMFIDQVPVNIFTHAAHLLYIAQHNFTCGQYTHTPTHTPTHTQTHTHMHRHALQA